MFQSQTQNKTLVVQYNKIGCAEVGIPFRKRGLASKTSATPFTDILEWSLLFLVKMDGAPTNQLTPVSHLESQGSRGVAILPLGVIRI